MSNRQSLELGRRLREVRLAITHVADPAALARTLGVPLEVWNSYEAGEIMPARIMLRFLVVTRTRPDWLLTGEGSRFELINPRFQHPCVSPESGPPEVDNLRL